MTDNQINNQRDRSTLAELRADIVAAACVFGVVLLAAWFVSLWWVG
ncbi:MAG: hypothetical protein ABSF87_10135 [Xanthobacteraceae bacterium]|jgi:hypothetical protein